MSAKAFDLDINLDIKSWHKFAIDQKYSFFTIPFILIAMIVSREEWMGGGYIFYLAFILVLGRNILDYFNRYIAKKFDVYNELEVKGLLFANVMMFLGMGLIFNYATFILFIFILGAIVGYTLFKNKININIHILYLATLSILPIIVSIAMNGYIIDWSVFLSISLFFYLVGFDLLSILIGKVDDKFIFKFDNKEYAFNVLLFLHLLAAIFYLVFSYFAEVGVFGWIAGFISLAFIGYEYLFIKYNKDYRPIFVSNVYFGLVYLLFIILDKVFM